MPDHIIGSGDMLCFPFEGKNPNHKELAEIVAGCPVSAFYKGIVKRKTLPATGESDSVRCAIQPTSCWEALGLFSFSQTHLAVVTTPSVSDLDQQRGCKDANHGSI